MNIFDEILSNVLNTQENLILKIEATEECGNCRSRQGLLNELFCFYLLSQVRRHEKCDFSQPGTAEHVNISLIPRNAWQLAHKENIFRDRQDLHGLALVRTKETGAANPKKVTPKIDIFSAPSGSEESTTFSSNFNAGR